MPRYIVAPGRIITNGKQPPLTGGQELPAGLLAELGEPGLAANLAAGSVIEEGPPAEAPSRESARRDRR